MRTFHDQFVNLFREHFPRLNRCLDRLCGEPDLAADLTQEAFIRLYRRGSMPEAPEAWLISVAMNLFRNERSTQARRGRLLTPARAEGVHAERPPAPDQEIADADAGGQVRRALDQLPARERSLLLLRAEGYSYREIASALDLNEASIGTLLARAKRAFLEHFGATIDAP